MELWRGFPVLHTWAFEDYFEATITLWMDGLLFFRPFFCFVFLGRLQQKIPQYTVITYLIGSNLFLSTNVTYHLLPPAPVPKKAAGSAVKTEDQSEDEKEIERHIYFFSPARPAEYACWCCQSLAPARKRGGGPFL